MIAEVKIKKYDWEELTLGIWSILERPDCYIIVIEGGEKLYLGVNKNIWLVIQGCVGFSPPIMLSNLSFEYAGEKQVVLSNYSMPK